MKSRRPAKTLTHEQWAEAAECLKAIAHPHRLRMLHLMGGGRPSVGELAAACGVTSPVASGHLRLMERCGLIEGRREGRNIYYQIAEPHLAPILACLESRFS